jgi:hypothetical protein
MEIDDNEVLKACSGQKVKLLGYQVGYWTSALKTEEGWKGVKVRVRWRQASGNCRNM